MQLRIDDIGEQGLELDYCEPPEDFPALADLQARHDVSFQEPVAVTGRVQRLGDLLEVEGQIRAHVSMPCSRCLESVSVPLFSRFAVTFSKTPPVVSEEGTDQEVELSAEEMGLVPFAGDEVDLTEVVQEQVIMALPLKPLCQADCRGLCPQCGIDLNRESCHCQAKVFNSGFGQLKDLKIKRDGSG